jgi:hypothetical protein
MNRTGKGRAIGLSGAVCGHEYLGQRLQCQNDFRICCVMTT